MYGQYVPPEQLMKDRSEYARKGIARGRSVVAMEYDDGILLLAENKSATLRKLSELYDRIAFAAVGKYSEFEELRIVGVRLADTRGYAYGREDVTAKTIANAYSQALSAIFTQQPKPYEVEVLVAELGHEEESMRMYHVLFDGSVNDVKGYVGIGGHAEQLTDALDGAFRSQMGLADAVQAAVTALGSVEAAGATEDASLEAAVLDRNRKGRRKFRRLEDTELAGILTA